jgi:hypothetical protein
MDSLPPFQIQVQTLAWSYFVNLISAYIEWIYTLSNPKSEAQQ